ncbi:MAG: hypothetical protein LBU66_05750, partial [Treponema sp.]|nr:hypothetical protein [Treponema sp.]
VATSPPPRSLKIRYDNRPMPLPPAANSRETFIVLETLPSWYTEALNGLLIFKAVMFLYTIIHNW